MCHQLSSRHLLLTQTFPVPLFLFQGWKAQDPLLPLVLVSPSAFLFSSLGPQSALEPSTLQIPAQTEPVSPALAVDGSRGAVA